MRKIRLYGTPLVAILALLAIVSYAVASNDGGKTHFKSDILTGYQEVVGPGPLAVIDVLPWILVLIAVAVIAGLIFVVLWRRRRKEDEEDRPPPPTT